MEEVTEAISNLIVSDTHKKSRIQVSNTKKPLFFYVNLAKRYMQQYNEVELSALGMVELSGNKVTFGNKVGSTDTAGVAAVCRSISDVLDTKQNGLRNAVGHVKDKYYLCMTLLHGGFPEHGLDKGMIEAYPAIATVVTIAEILKNNGLAIEKKIMTSTVDMKDESRGRPIQKAKIEILLGKTANFDELMAAAAEEREVADGEEQS